MVKQNKNMKTETETETDIGYHPNGKIKYKYSRVNGYRHGECIEYYKNGKIKLKRNYICVECEDGEYIEYLHGEYIGYYENSQIKHKCNYVNGETHGEHIDYYVDGIIHRKVGYNYGEMHGEYIEYYENGNVKEKIDYHYGMRCDKLIEYYKNGNIRRNVDYHLGEIYGKYLIYYESGNLMGETDYVNDEMHGKHFEYYENGNLMAKSDYVNGKILGKHFEYHKNGQIMEERDYVIGAGNFSMDVKSVGYDEFGFCTHHYEIDTNKNIIMNKKWGRIYGTHGDLTYEDHKDNTCMFNHIVPNPNPLKEGDIFYCEGRYYEITRGSLKKTDLSIKKSTNLQIRHLEWQLDSAYIEVIDDAKKEIIDCSVYKLKPSGNKFTKFMTAKKNFEITVMNNAELVVKHKKVKQREKYLEEIIKGINKTLYPEIVD